MIDTKLAEKIVTECAVELDQETRNGYTHVQLNVCVHNATPTVQWKCYQNGSSWTADHPTWDAAKAEAVSPEFLDASIRQDILEKEKELAELRAKLNKGKA